MNFLEKTEEIIEKVKEFVGSKLFPGLLIASAVVGLLGVEYLYFVNAEKVRLLFVLLLVPVGILGGLAALYLIVLAVVITVVGGVVAIVVGSVVGIIYLLYRIIVWTN